MFDEVNRSFMDLDNSFLLQSDYEHPEGELPDMPLLEDRSHDSNTQAPPTVYLGSTTHSSKSEPQSETAIIKGYKNPKYKPIVDNGVTYVYDRDPYLYKKIRK